MTTGDGDPATVDRRAGPTPSRMPLGLILRRAGRSDVTAITRLISASTLAHNGASDADPSDVEHAFDLADREGVVVAADDAGDIVGWATVAGSRAQVDVHPDWRGSGIGSQLLEWSEAHALATGSDRVHQTVTDANQAAHALLQARGYRPGHVAWVLEIQLGPERPKVNIPPEIDIRPFQRADAADAYRLIEDAFNEWPGRSPQAFERWAAHVLDHPAFAPGLSRVAFAGGHLVGGALNLAYDESPEGWVTQLATKATHRHRGIARALLRASFAAFHDTGRRLVCLSTDSRTGALGLYEGAGMRIRSSYTARSKLLAPQSASLRQAGDTVSNP